jgi:hypothetical protein
MRTGAAVVVLGAFAAALGLAAMACPGSAVAGDIYQLQADNREAVDRILFECEQSYLAAALDPIRDKVELSHPRKGVVVYRASPVSNSYPTGEERQAIHLWASLRRTCVNRIATFLENAPLPAAANRDTANWGNSFFLRGMSASGDLVAALSQGQLTYAAYAGKRAELVSKVDAEHARWYQAMLMPDAVRGLHEAEQADRRFHTYLADFVGSVGRQAEQGEQSPQPSHALAAAAPSLYEAPLAISYPKGPVHPDDIAVIIGNGDYTKQGRDIPNIRPAHADAASMRVFATQALGIREDNIISLTDATAAQMLAVFGSDKDHRGQLYDWVKSGRSRVFIYYAGHGAPSGDSGGPYLVPTDAEASRVTLSAYPLPLLYDNLSRLPAESVTVVLEACFSGQTQAGSLVPKASPVMIVSKMTAPPANVTVIAAAAGDQIASWEQDETHGLFTEYFLRGMSGEADKPPHGNGDGTVSLDELDRYLKETLTYLARRYWGRDQVAQFARGGGK